MSPREEIAAAVKTLADATERADVFAERWAEVCDLPGLLLSMRAFVRAMNPAVGREIADWLSDWEDYEFREDGPMPDDLAAALRIARAVNKAVGNGA